MVHIQLVQYIHSLHFMIQTNFIPIEVDNYPILFAIPLIILYLFPVILQFIEVLNIDLIFITFQPLHFINIAQILGYCSVLDLPSLLYNLSCLFDHRFITVLHLYRFFVYLHDLCYCSILFLFYPLTHQHNKLI